MNMEVKNCMYERIIMPTFLYGSEAWNLKEIERKKLNVNEMRCLRSMCGVTRRDQIRNEVIRSRTRVMKPLSERSDQSMLRWFGHLERMGNGRLVKRVWEGRVGGTRPRGRPKLGWDNGIRGVLEARGLTWEVAKERARDRRGWRKIVKDGVIGEHS